MEYNTNEKKRTVVYVDPVKVEDCPLPIHIRIQESAKRTAHTVFKKMRGKGILRKALYLAIALVAVAAAPALLIWLLVSALGKTRRATGIAF